MLVIRNAQMQAFTIPMFLNWLEGHLRRFFPDKCEALGPRGLRELMSHGLERARSYGFTAEQDLCRYVDVMMAFGRDFDQQLDWATDILRDPSIRVPAMRMELLHEAALAHDTEVPAEESRPA